MPRYCKSPVALPHCAWVSLQFVIMVFPDHTHLLAESNLQAFNTSRLGVILHYAIKSVNHMWFTDS